MTIDSPEAIRPCSDRALPIALINVSIGNPPVVEVCNPQWSPGGRYIFQEVAILSRQEGAATASTLNSGVGPPIRKFSEN